jgi:plastocyanin
MNQAPTTREIWVQWEKGQSGQDRFNPSLIVVNQGDTVKLTFINNDTVIHNFVIGAPYHINVNASVPGLINDLTGQEVTGPATNNSPGVIVTGSPGSVTARYTFVAQYAGIYEFVCTYHVAIGMFGYLVVLPNAAFQAAITTTTTTPSSPTISLVTILPGAAYPNSTGYSPPVITVVIGVNNTVEWVNNDSAPHTVTATDRSFDSGNLNPGDTWTYTFNTPGTYTYVCTYHPWMKGTVIVLAH